MTEQLDLFGGVNEMVAKPAAARRTDPESSHEAADRMNQGAAQRNVEIVTDAVWKWPGRTSRELSELIGDLDRWEVARRLPNAETRGNVKRGEKRKCSVAGTNAVTWWPAG